MEKVLDRKTQRLRHLLDESSYTVALCGSGMLLEGGAMGFKTPQRAYEVEMKYGRSPEEILSSMFYNTRQPQFFRFYKNEILKRRPAMTESGPVLAAMERLGKLQCIISSNIYGHAKQAGCKRVIEIRGSVHRNWCPHCGTFYPMEYVRDSVKVPLCEKCHSTIRPLISLYGEMVDSQLMTQTTEEIAKADLLLLLGTSFVSETFSNYIKYFRGRNIVVIHEEERFKDDKADLVILGQPRYILTRLGYLEEEQRLQAKEGRTGLGGTERAERDTEPLDGEPSEDTPEGRPPKEAGDGPART